MAAPNIVNVGTITGKTVGVAVTTSLSTLVDNPASSGKVFKVNALYASNVDGTNNANVTVTVQISSTDYHIAKTITVPADSTIDVLSKPVYLEEGHTMRISAGTASDIEAVASYEEIS